VRERLKIEYTNVNQRGSASCETTSRQFQSLEYSVTARIWCKKHGPCLVILDDVTLKNVLEIVV
jgi:hypothetical protein